MSEKNNKMKNNMAYAVLSVRVRMAMWNAAFSKYAKETSMGIMYGSSQALGYAIKAQMDRDGSGRILFKRRVNEEGVMSLKDSFEYGLGEKTKECTTELKTKEVLFETYEDVVQFGAVMALSTYPNFGILGAAQIGIGMNKLENSGYVVNEMLPCFSAESAKQKAEKAARAAKIAKGEKVEEVEEKMKSNTLGEQILVDKAQYLYDMTVNPFEYAGMVEEMDTFDGYTEENYKNLKKASLKAVSNLNSKAKKGCTTDFAMFVETTDETKDNIDLNCLSQYIDVYEKGEIIVYNLEKVADLLNQITAELKSVEVYLDKRLVEIEGNIDSAKYFDIKTKKEIVKNEDSIFVMVPAKEEKEEGK